MKFCEKKNRRLTGNEGKLKRKDIIEMSALHTNWGRCAQNALFASVNISLNQNYKLELDAIVS